MLDSYLSIETSFYTSSHPQTVKSSHSMAMKVLNLHKSRLFIQQLRKDQIDIGSNFNNGPTAQEKNNKPRVLSSHYRVRREADCSNSVALG